jgi:hypothetical protein
MTSGSDLDSGDSQVTLPAGQGAGGPAPDTGEEADLDIARTLSVFKSDCGRYWRAPRLPQVNVPRFG